MKRILYLPSYSYDEVVFFRSSGFDMGKAGFICATFDVADDPVGENILTEAGKVNCSLSSLHCYFKASLMCSLQ